MAHVTRVSVAEQQSGRQSLPSLDNTAEQTVNTIQRWVLIILVGLSVVPTIAWLVSHALITAATFNYWHDAGQFQSLRPSPTIGQGNIRTHGWIEPSQAWSVLLLELRLIVGGMIALYTINGLWQAIMFYTGGRNSTFISVSSAEIVERQSRPLPWVTALIPIRSEEEPVIRHLAQSLAKLNYPPDRLQILILLDEGAEDTIELVKTLMPESYQALVFAPFPPRSKPRVLNGALPFIRGQYTTVWDVEDSPDPNQLIKAVIAFERMARIPDQHQIVCLQARLAFDLSRVKGHNLWTRILTSWQASAYNWHFDGHEVSPGGTSNVIITDRLMELGGWDGWNMAEDLNLGVWIVRRGWRVGMINSITWEEPNTQLWNCVRQWSRWTKGRMQTYLVHMRHPWRLSRQLGLRGTVDFQLRIGLPVLMLLANPVFMAVSVAYFVTGSALISTLFPLPVLYAGNLCLVAGNIFFIFATATASLRQRQYGLVLATLLSLGHWLLLSLAAYKALGQLLFGRAHHWEATKHGLTETEATTTIAPVSWRPAGPNLAVLESVSADAPELERFEPESEPGSIAN